MWKIKSMEKASFSEFFFIFFIEIQYWVALFEYLFEKKAKLKLESIEWIK